MTQQWWHETTILETVGGSHAYGLATATSDVDIRGICMLPAEYLLGAKRFEQGNGPGKDQVTYGLPKFVVLALDCNPNIIEMLFSDGHYQYLYLNEYGKRLLAHRHLFLSTKAQHTFSGYAFSQLGRIERHHRWLTSPPDEPKQEEFGGVWDGSTYRWPDLQHKSGYDNARKHYDDYRTWKQKRNPARSDLEAQFGYDTKHASHLCRLMVMAKELLSTGMLHVNRTGIDADWLRQVRAGHYTYEELVEWARSAEAELDEVAAQSPLPRQPDRTAVEAMLIDMQMQFISEGNYPQRKDDGN